MLGLGAVACIACCAGPILAIVGGLSLAGFAGTVRFGAFALVLALPAAIAFVVLRRRRSACGSASPEPDSVAAPTRKIPAA